MTLMTTRAFARMVIERGFNRDALQALEAISTAFNLKPIVNTVVEGNTLVGGSFDP